MAKTIYMIFGWWSFQAILHKANFVLYFHKTFSKCKDHFYGHQAKSAGPTIRLNPPNGPNLLLHKVLIIQKMMMGFFRTFLD